MLSKLVRHFRAHFNEHISQTARLFSPSSISHKSTLTDTVPVTAITPASPVNTPLSDDDNPRHVPVMLHETVDLLQPENGQVGYE